MEKETDTGEHADDIFSAVVEAPVRPARRLRLRAVPIRVLIPNVVTLISLCAGLTSLRMALEGRIEFAVYCIIIAALLDGIDGRLARMLGGTSKFGAQLDSLADFFNFGVAPGFLLYVWGLHDLKSLGWVAVLLFAIAGALRLARFNVALEDDSRPAFTNNFFVGVPAPAGAALVLLPVYLSQLSLPALPLGTMLVWGYCIFIGLMMVSSLPTWSPKKIGSKVRREFIAPIFFGVVLLVALLVSYPWEVLSACSIAYLASLPLAYKRYKKLEAAHNRANAAEAQTNTQNA